MPRRRLPPRLYLRPAHGRNPSIWVIRDGANEISTGCRPGDNAGAARALQAYLASIYRPPADVRRPQDLLIVEVMTIYARERSADVARPDMLLYTCDRIIAWWGGKTLASIRGATCREYVEHVGSSAAARRDLETMRAAINHYHREHGPLDAVPAVTLPEKWRPRLRWLTRDEVAAMLWSCRRLGERYRHAARVILIGVYSGTRSGAIYRLRWLAGPTGGHVDLDAGVIYRQPAGAKKTKKRAPPVKIHFRLLPHLRRWQRQDAVLGLASVVHYHGQPVEKLRRSWAAVRADAGFDADVIPHTLRHTSATWLAQAGVPAWEAAGYLGMTVQMFDEVYGHHSPDHQSNASSSRAPRKSPATREPTVIKLGDRRSKTSAKP